MNKSHIRIFSGHFVGTDIQPFHLSLETILKIYHDKYLVCFINII